MPDKTFSVSVVTPDGPAFEGEAVMLIVPGADGEIGVLARHAPLIATLKAGSTRVHVSDSDVREYATGPGLLVERGESSADRWQLEQRIKHAENQLTVLGR